MTLAASRAAVIIVAWQDHGDLDACFDGLTRQTLTDFHVVVADNGAGLTQRLTPWEQRLDLIRVDMGINAGVSAARNAAAAATDAPLLLFLDDDAVPAAEWVETFVRLMEATDAVAARGRVVGKRATALNDLARAYDLGDAVRPAILNTEGNCVIRRDAYRRIGGFREDMFGHEGAEISRRLLDADSTGEGILYAPGALIRHDYVEGLGGYLRKKFRHGTMLRHVDPAVTRWAAGKARRSSPWTIRRVAMLPVKAVGLVAEAAGVLAAAVPSRRRSGAVSA